MRSLTNVPLPANLSGLSRPELEALLVQQSEICQAADVWSISTCCGPVFFEGVITAGLCTEIASEPFFPCRITAWLRRDRDEPTAVDLDVARAEAEESSAAR